MQTFTAPVSGNYKLEVWGASGMFASETGGYGGYSVGNIMLEEKDALYICTGEKGSSHAGAPLGIYAYNGGGCGQQVGGGCTHIATTNRGELYNYENYQSEVLLVAGGGGGSDYYAGTGGHGGGTIGGDSHAEGNMTIGGLGGTQTTGGIGGNPGTFGRGGDSVISGEDSGGSGGGGWYGGGGSTKSSNSGGGGSGHINTTLITNGETIVGDQTFPSPSGGTETGHEGDGYAIIIWRQLPQ